MDFLQTVFMPRASRRGRSNDCISIVRGQVSGSERCSILSKNGRAARWMIELSRPRSPEWLRRPLDRDVLIKSIFMHSSCVALNPESIIAFVYRHSGGCIDAYRAAIANSRRSIVIISPSKLTAHSCGRLLSSCAIAEVCAL